MDVTEAARTLGIAPGSVRDAIARGKLAATRKNGSEKRAGYLLIAREEVERYRKENLGKRGTASPEHPQNRRKGSEQ